jgi:hypothetical protein
VPVGKHVVVMLVDIDRVPPLSTFCQTPVVNTNM